jgi:hypothetical protein
MNRGGKMEDDHRIGQQRRQGRHIRGALQKGQSGGGDVKLGGPLIALAWLQTEIELSHDIGALSVFFTRRRIWGRTSLLLSFSSARSRL